MRRSQEDYNEGQPIKRIARDLAQSKHRKSVEELASKRLELISRLAILAAAGEFCQANGTTIVLFISKL